MRLCRLGGLLQVCLHARRKTGYPRTDPCAPPVLDEQICEAGVRVLRTAALRTERERVLSWIILFYVVYALPNL